MSLGNKSLKQYILQTKSLTTSCKHDFNLKRTKQPSREETFDDCLKWTFFPKSEVISKKQLHYYPLFVSFGN